MGRKIAFPQIGLGLDDAGRQGLTGQFVDNDLAEQIRCDIDRWPVVETAIEEPCRRKKPPIGDRLRTQDVSS